MSLTSWLKKRRSLPGMAAVELAPDGICAARVIRSPGVPPLLDVCQFLPVDEGREAPLQALVREHGLERTVCSSVVSTGSYSLLLVEAPDVPADELRAAIRWRIKDMLDFHIDDAVLDVFDVPARRTAAGGRQMYVVAARAQDVKGLIRDTEGAGLDLQTIDVPELALRNLSALLPEDVAGVALVYLNREAGLILLTRQSTLYLARQFDTGPIRGHQAADDVAPPWLDALVVEVQRSLDYYESHFAQAPIQHLVIAPMAHQVPGMARYLGDQLRLNVRQLDLGSVLDSAEPIPSHTQAHCLPAVGAALRVEERQL